MLKLCQTKMALHNVGNYHFGLLSEHLTIFISGITLHVNYLFQEKQCILHLIYLVTGYAPHS